MAEVAAEFPERTVTMVAGNCDIARMEPAERLLELAGRRLLMLHGHTRRVKAGLTPAIAAARAKECDLLLYGHTHTPFVGYEEGLHILCPGSIARRNSHTYGVVDITPAGVVCFTHSPS